MPKKRTTLPKDFEGLLDRGDFDVLRAVFDRCALDARGGSYKQVALAFPACPDALARWLVENGADIEATDRDGKTPLHTRARSHRGRIAELLQLGADPNPGAGSYHGTPLHAAADAAVADNVRLLLEHGAQVDARNAARQTPLEYMLQRASNATLERVSTVARLLLDAGATPSDEARQHVIAIGERFEFHRANFNPACVNEASAALNRLYAMTGVAPVPRRTMHDGASPITVRDGSWDERYDRLWDLLVPSQGAAATVQGEVVRIPGRLAREIHGNGAVNWDRDYVRMADAWLGYVAVGEPLAPDERAEALEIIADVKRKAGDTDRLREFAVAWVARNPEPIPLPAPPYSR